VGAHDRAAANDTVGTTLAPLGVLRSLTAFGLTARHLTARHLARAAAAL